MADKGCFTFDCRLNANEIEADTVFLYCITELYSKILLCSINFKLKYMEVLIIL